MRKQRSSVPCECKCLKDPKYNKVEPIDESKLKLLVSVQRETSFRSNNGYVEVEKIELTTTHKPALDELVKFLLEWQKHWGEKK
jgi:hypothetical protein